MKCIDKFGE